MALFEALRKSCCPVYSGFPRGTEVFRKACQEGTGSSSAHPSVVREQGQCPVKVQRPFPFLPGSATAQAEGAAPARPGFPDFIHLPFG